MISAWKEQLHDTLDHLPRSEQIAVLIREGWTAPEAAALLDRVHIPCASEPALEKTMIVAYYFPHNDGLEKGIMDGPGQSTQGTLVDLYEVDGQIRTFSEKPEAEAWLDHKEDHPYPGKIEGCKFCEEETQEMNEIRGVQ